MASPPEISWVFGAASPFRPPLRPASPGDVIPTPIAKQEACQMTGWGCIKFIIYCFITIIIVGGERHCRETV